MFNIIMRFFIALAVGIISIMPILYPIMINSRFNSGYGLVPISILGSLFNVVVGLISVIYVGKKNTKAIANTSVVSAIINIIVHLVLIKFIGLYAAIISTLTAFVIMSVYRIIDINKTYFKIELDKKMLCKTVFVVMVVVVLYYINNIFLNLMSILIAILFAWNLNKNSIKIIINMLKNKVKKVR